MTEQHNLNTSNMSLIPNHSNTEGGMGAQQSEPGTGTSSSGRDTQRVELTIMPDEMRDLAPMIYRQRLVVEGLVPEPVGEEQIRAYLSQLSDVCEMKRLIDPVTHCSEQFGWAGWVHWETSGAHFYAWDDPVPFFSVDIYTCRPFEPMRAVEFTADFFAAEQVVAKGY